MAMMAMRLRTEAPQGSRQRLLDAIAKEPRGCGGAVGSPPRFNWWAAFGGQPRSRCCVVIQLRRRTGHCGSRWSSWIPLLGNRRSNWKCTAGGGCDYSSGCAAGGVVTAKTPAVPRGKAFYLRNKNSLVFVPATWRRWRRTGFMSCGCCLGAGASHCGGVV